MAKAAKSPLGSRGRSPYPPPPIDFPSLSTNTPFVPNLSSSLRPLFASLGWLALLSSGVSLTADPASYENDAAPLFAAHCLRCHGSDEQKSKLRLDSPEWIQQGGDSGEPLIVPGNAEASFVYQVIAGTHTDLQMPPKGDPVPPEDLNRLATWINQGARFPHGPYSPTRQLTTAHWSFQPVQRPPLPAQSSSLERNPIDRFVFHRLRSQDLSPSPLSDRRTLIRRLYLVLLGLPPTPEEVETFLQDQSPNAYERLVDRVLHSPRYGERWARHWLDVVRYADTNGFETNRERKTAYRYRDFVIDAFNQDRPYDQFIRDQIAGDSLGQDVGTGFLVAGPYDIVKSPDINLTLAQRQDELADMVNTTGTAFLGLTIGCARCHNHKFDPILQKDYYSLQAVFAGVNHGERSLQRSPNPLRNRSLKKLETSLQTVDQQIAVYRHQAKNTADDSHARLREPVNFKSNTEVFPSVKARFVRFQINATSSGSEPCLDEIEVYNEQEQNVALAQHGTEASASGTLPGFSIHQLKHLNDGRTGNAHSWISNTPGSGWIILKFPEPESIHRIIWGRDRQEQFRDRLPIDYEIEASLDGAKWQPLASSQDRSPFQGKTDPLAFLEQLPPEDAAQARRLMQRQKSLNQEIDELRNGPKAWVANFDTPPPTHRLYRGEPLQKRERVAPDALTVTGSLNMSLDEPESQRRAKLARWIASEHNPLTARVIVNRLWHYIFGRGIVATPSDFGANGIAPTHPQLLDWLASELIAAQWSLKHIQRLILTAHTFQQSSRPHPEGLQQDANAVWLWRFPPLRLEAEAIRDSILHVAGQLDLQQGGPGFYLHRVQQENVMHYFPKETFGPEDYRRMVYLFKIRQEQDAIFGAFDCPDGNQTIPRRSRSNTPLQALNLFNSPFIQQQASDLATRIQQETGPGATPQIDRAFVRFFGRSPDRYEHQAALELVNAEGLVALCRALYNSSEFLFVF